MDRVYTSEELKELGVLGFIDSTLIETRIPNSINSYLATAPVEMKNLINECLELNRAACLIEMGKEPIFDDEADYEHSVENLLRFHSIVKALDGNVVIRNNRSRKISYRLYLNSKPVGTLDDQASQDIKYLFGPRSSQEFHHELDNDWYRSAVLSEYTGRRIEVAGHTPDGPSFKDVYQVLREFKEAGIRYAFVKMIQTKAMALKVDLEQVDWSMFDPLEILMFHLEGRSEVYMVQEWIPMEYEYRFMVVNNKIVSGAANIEDNTPLDRKMEQVDGVLHLQAQKTRGLKNKVTIESGIIRQLRAEAESLITEYVEEQRQTNPEFALYGTVDMACTDDTKTPVLVEINGLSNAGLFANSPSLIAEAIVSNAKLGIYDEQSNDDFKMIDKNFYNHNNSLLALLSSVDHPDDSETFPKMEFIDYGDHDEDDFEEIEEEYEEEEGVK